jgi:hypothetical protein
MSMLVATEKSAKMIEACRPSALFRPENRLARHEPVYLQLSIGSEKLA